MWEIAKDTKAVLTHSDLYGEHIFIDGDTLSGVIDFGAAFIATPGWEFAVLAYYHGWESVRLILEGYTSGQERRNVLMRQAKYLAVVVGLYKLEKAVRKAAQAEKQQRILDVVTATLNQLRINEKFRLS